MNATTIEKEINLALIGAAATRHKLIEVLERFGGFRVVHQADDTRTRSSGLRKMRLKRPRWEWPVVLIITGGPNTFVHELDPELAIRRFDGFPVIFRTELPEEHPFIIQAKASEANIIHEGVDYRCLAAGIRRVAAGEKICWYPPRGHVLDTYSHLPSRALI